MTTILNHAERFAQSIIQDQVNEPGINANAAHQSQPGVIYPSSTQTVHHYHHNYQSWDSWFWRPHFYQPVYVYPTPSYSTYSNRNSKKKEETDHTPMIIGAGIVVAAAASYLIGKAAGSLSHLNQRLKTLAVEKETVDPSSKIAQVIRIEEKMVHDIKESTKTGFKLNGILAASAALATLGATLFPPVLAGGLVGVGLSGAAHLVRKGFLDADTTQKEDAALLLQAVNEARAELKA